MNDKDNRCHRIRDRPCPRAERAGTLASGLLKYGFTGPEVMFNV